LAVAKIKGLHLTGLALASISNYSLGTALP
jgi:hypothetical protein